MTATTMEMMMTTGTFMMTMMLLLLLLLLMMMTMIRLRQLMQFHLFVDAFVQVAELPLPLPQMLIAYG
jgi:hypothetical protein